MFLLNKFNREKYFCFVLFCTVTGELFTLIMLVIGPTFDSLDLDQLFWK